MLVRKREFPHTSLVEGCLAVGGHQIGRHQAMEKVGSLCASTSPERGGTWARGDPRPQLGRSVPHIRFDALRERRLTLRLCGSAGRSVEDVSCLEHAVHDDRKLSGDRHCSALEAQPLTQLRG